MDSYLITELFVLRRKELRAELEDVLLAKTETYIPEWMKNAQQGAREKQLVKAAVESGRCTQFL